MLREPMGRRRMIATPYRRATVGRISGETGKPSGLGTCVETAVTRSSEVTVVHELRLLGDTSGAHWTTSIGAQDYWQQYLTTFDSVKIVARVSPLHSSIVGARRIDGPQIVVHAVPPYRGLVSLLVNLPKVLRSVARATGSADCLVLYLPGVLGTFAALFSAARRRSYAVYVLGDIDEVLGPGGPGGMARPVLRRFATGITRWAVRTASVQAYVTAGALQARYPPRAGLGTVHCLAESELAELPVNPVAVRAAANRLSAVGSMEQHYKGFDTLIAAVRLLEDGGMPVHLTIVGSGRHAGHYAGLASRLGLGDAVVFTGQVAGSAEVITHLSRSDLFVLSSITEGLPRSLLEAMACGLPCVATNVGGVPEVLDQSFLVEPGRPDQLAGKIREVLLDHPRRIEAAAENRATATQFLRPLQGERRNAFLRDVAAARLSSNSERSTWRLRSRFHGMRRSGR